MEKNQVKIFIIYFTLMILVLTLGLLTNVC
jgi:hypothetical protein